MSFAGAGKLKPTGAERLIWGKGDGSTLTAVETERGVMGGLICWENYMPLARMAMYSKGIENYLAPTADARDTWQATLRHIACEGRCFVLGCNQFMTKEMYPTDLEGIEDLVDQPEVLCRGGSAIISQNYMFGDGYGASTMAVQGERIALANMRLNRLATDGGSPRAGSRTPAPRAASHIAPRPAPPPPPMLHRPLEYAS